MVNWQLSKKVSTDQSHDCIVGSGIQLIEVTNFNVICWPVIGLQVIVGSSPFFKVGILFALCLRQKLNYLALAKSIY